MLMLLHIACLWYIYVLCIYQDGWGEPSLSVFNEHSPNIPALYNAPWINNWVIQKLPQICNLNLRVCIGKVA